LIITIKSGWFGGIFLTNENIAGLGSRQKDLLMETFYRQMRKDFEPHGGKETIAAGVMFDAETGQL